MSDIKKVAICGAAGTMGAGIAIVAARGGMETVCFDMSADGLAKARGAAQKFFDRSIEKGRITREQGEAALSRMSETTDLQDLADCDLVIEAIFEDLGAKQELLGKLDTVCKPATIFASNTSTLSITQIAAGCDRQAQVVGMHFCLPAQVMKLIEMSPGLNTSEITLSKTWQWTEAVGQKPVETQDRPGFILNALLVPFNNDVVRAVEVGLATPEDIDTAICAGLGYKMGPCTLLDLVGLDTQIRLGEAFYPITLEERAAVPPLLRRMVAAGKLGNKSGQGLLGVDSPNDGNGKASASFAVSLIGQSRSFPEPTTLFQDAMGASDGEVTVHFGGAYEPDADKLVVLVELNTECLGEHTGEDMGREGSNVVGFARYRNGSDHPSDMVEVVRQPNTDPAALRAAQAFFQASGFTVATCKDLPGRIVDRLVRPKYNAALRLLDDGLASAADIDKTCCMGLGYPDGPIERVTRGGLANHYDVTQAIYEMSGLPGYFPARAAVVAKRGQS